MQVERQQNSIIQSLSELRAIEAQRIADEREAVRRADEARRAEQAAAEQRAREEAEARARAEHEAQLALEKARLEAEREVRLKVEAAAAAELARQQVALEQARMEEDARLRREALAKTRPTWMVAVTCVATLAAGVLVWFALSSRNSAADAKEKERQAQLDRDRAKEESRQAQLELERIAKDLEANSAVIQQLIKRVELAQTEADRKKANDELQREKDRLARIAAAQAKANKEKWDKERRDGVKISEECQNGVFGKGCPAR
jgi:hypothetical protein